MGKNDNAQSPNLPNLYPFEAEAYEAHEAQFIQLIWQRLGIKTPPKNKELQKIVLSACQKFACKPDTYLEMLTTCKDSSPVLEHLVTGITIGETYFFRDQRQMHFLRFILLPRIIQKKREQKNLSLRIWSAGCASGEEIYTMAMMLHELLPDFSHWILNLLGTDINTQSLQKARLAHYNEWSMRSISNYHKEQYLTESNKHYVLSEKIKDCVNFMYLNLNDNTYPSLLNGTNSQDLILCRNVLIYFNHESIRQVMKKLNLSLSEEGYLILGASDPVFIEDTDLHFHHTDGLVFSRQKAHTKPAAPIKSKTTTTAPPFLIPQKKEAQLAVPIPKQSANPAGDLCLKAKGSANIGRLDLALTYCQESLKLDSTNKDTYFIYALTLLELGNTAEAEAALRKTLFLDRKFIEGHFQLGLLLLKNKCNKAGLKSLENALAIVNTHEPSHIVPNSQGLSYGRFAEILHAEITLYTVAGSPIDANKK